MKILTEKERENLETLKGKNLPPALRNKKSKLLKKIKEPKFIENIVSDLDQLQDLADPRQSPTLLQLLIMEAIKKHPELDIIFLACSAKLPEPKSGLILDIPEKGVIMLSSKKQKGIIYQLLFNQLERSILPGQSKYLTEEEILEKTQLVNIVRPLKQLIAMGLVGCDNSRYFCIAKEYK